MIASLIRTHTAPDLALYCSASPEDFVTSDTAYLFDTDEESSQSTRSIPCQYASSDSSDLSLASFVSDTDSEDIETSPILATSSHVTNQEQDQTSTPPSLVSLSEEAEGTGNTRLQRPRLSFAPNEIKENQHLIFTTTLPIELHKIITNNLTPQEAVCLSLTCKSFYTMHSHFLRIVPLWQQNYQGQQLCSLLRDWIDPAHALFFDTRARKFVRWESRNKLMGDRFGKWKKEEYRDPKLHGWADYEVTDFGRPFPRRWLGCA